MHLGIVWKGMSLQGKTKRLARKNERLKLFGECRQVAVLKL